MKSQCFRSHPYDMSLVLSQENRGSNTIVSWNHAEFECRFESLTDEIKIGMCLCTFALIPLSTRPAPIEHLSMQWGITCG